MSLTLSELTEQARRLSAQERACLAEALLESLREAPPSDVEAAWDREIAERAAAYDRGERKTFPAEEVFDEGRRLTQ